MTHLELGPGRTHPCVALNSAGSGTRSTAASPPAARHTGAPRPVRPGNPPRRRPPHSAADRRAVGTRAGVADDDLSVAVLVGGLRPAGDGPLARGWPAFCAEAGQAASLTLAQLRARG